MRHSKVLAGALFAGAMVIGTLTPSMAKKFKEAMEPDNAEYGERLEVDFNHPDVLPNPYKAANAKPTSVSLYYRNDNADCAKREFWIWAAGVDGSAFTPTVTDGGKQMEVHLDFTGAYANFYGKPSIFFIVKYKKGTPEGGGDGWQGQSLNVEVKYEDEFAPDANGHVDIWSIHGEGTSIEVYPNKEGTTTDRFTSASFTDWKHIKVTATAAPKNYKVYALTSNYMNHTMTANLDDYLIAEGGEQSSSTFTITLNYTAKINIQYLIEGYFPKYPDYKKQKYVSAAPLYEYKDSSGNNRFKTYYTYSGDDLGSYYNGPDSTTFKVWAPAAANVRVFLYNSGSDSTYIEEDPTATDSMAGGYDMAFRPGGIWQVTIKNRDLKGMYYTYQVANSLGKAETMDPYAKACGVNGKRGMIVDWSETNPEGWDTVPAVWDGVSGYDINNPNELSIYETHIRDLTMDDTWTGSSMKGTYSAFSEKGTTYAKNSITVKTGYDHIEEFGVKAIQLIPVFDNDNMEGVNERSYNWGYNPLNYNCVDGSYATDPYNGISRIKEFKSLIKAYSENENHTRIIMDVVYNHVSSLAQSCFNKLMPYYYFRYTKNNEPYNGSGCGNEVKTEAPMMSKYIVDSLVWWAKEYKIKGFRFDLMGLIDWKTIKKAAEELYKIDKDIYLYGEGWSMGCNIDSSLYPDTWGADTSTVYSKLYKQGDMVYVGGFNDAARNAIAGETGNAGDWGFIDQGAEHVGSKSTTVADMLVGYHTGKGGNPNQMVAYSSCHDDFSTFDHILYNLREQLTGEDKRSVGDVCAAVAAVESTIMMSNGVAFIQGGQECFLTKEVSAEDLAKYGTDRTILIEGKRVSDNSYRLSDYTNSIKWDRKIAIDSTSTNEFYQAMKNAVHTRNQMAKYDYNYLQTHNPYNSSSPFYVEGHGDGKVIIHMHNNSYDFFVAGNTGENCVNGYWEWANTDRPVAFASNPVNNGFDKVTGGMKIYWYSCFCFR